MWALLLTTIVTSGVDSINPIAISQQFALQGMVKKARHIWFFIISIAVTNFTGGFLAYFGLITPISNFFKWIVEQYSQSIYTLELVIGISFLIAVSYSLQNTKIAALKKEIIATKHKEAEKENNKLKSVSPLSLTVLGIVATLSELTSAVPYFAFLTILFKYQLSILQVTGILFLYNLIYSLPLIILYFVYLRARNKFDNFYKIIKIKMEKLTTIIIPIVFSLIGTLLIFHSISKLI